VIRFPYTAFDERSATLMPRLGLSLTYQQTTIEVIGLLDTGSTVNVLPYSAGLALKAVWHSQPIIPELSGSLKGVEVRALDAFAFHPQLTPSNPVQLVFAWAESDHVPVIFGQMNFFMEFHVCFYRAQNAFEVTAK
jgi:hypothetical protein